MSDLKDIKRTLDEFRKDFFEFKGYMESEVGSNNTKGNITRNLNYLSKSVNSMQEDINEIKVSLAVHEVKIGRSSAFYGAVSGLVVAVLTAVIVNFTVNQSKTDQPKVIYKNSNQENILKQD